jgi:outer membrane cobalamin receptor
MKEKLQKLNRFGNVSGIRKSFIWKSSCLSLAILMFIYHEAGAQSNMASISGQVRDGDGNTIPFASIALKNTKFGTTSDQAGSFLIRNIPEGIYILQVQFLGYETLERKVDARSGRIQQLDIFLNQNAFALNEVVVSGKSNTAIARQQAFTVTAIDARPLKNTSKDINMLLGQSSGIRIREEGGLGSRFSFSLNGFSGNQVRFFMDGIPMDHFGSSLSLNNFPVNMIERVEVYKGVVPVYLGSDALGGAINIITNQSAKNYLDVSYSLGSFNTHRAAIIAGYTDKKTGLVARVNAFVNYSDNDYDITVEHLNNTRVKRFNDAYHSQSLQVELGLRDKKFADQIFIGIIVSGNYKETQHGYNITKVAGEVFETDNVFIPTFSFKKENVFIEGLSLKLNALYNSRQALEVDTSSKMYDWYGNYTQRELDVNAGELNWDKTLFRFNDKSAVGNSNLKYEFLNRHAFSIHNAYSIITRVGDDPLSYSPVPYSEPNTLTKNITGFSYAIELFERKWNSSVFAKSFFMDAKTMVEVNSSDEFIPQQKNYFHSGYGIASTYFIRRSIQFKISYETTYRLPDAYELFGNGLLFRANTGLKPEQSRNLNTGFIATGTKGRHRIEMEGGWLYRLVSDYIFIQANANTSMATNLGYVRISSLEGNVKYIYNQWFNIEINGTYQDLVNFDKNDGVLYLDRLPNVPYLFGNLTTGIRLEDIGWETGVLDIAYSAHFVETFYLRWPGQGGLEDKYSVPRQLNHNLSVSYSLRNGRYNVSLTCSNLANKTLYDNFRMPKPGRAFTLKLRCFLSKDA